MAKGVALLVGLEYVNPDVEDRYDDYKAGCFGVGQDLIIMKNILENKGYTVEDLKNKKATSDNILNSLFNISKKLKKGDIFTFYYSGHGGSKTDLNRDELDDHQDETLVVYDRDLVDDELNSKWLQFKEGVRILMVSDNCNSGTNYKAGDDIRQESKPILIDKHIDKEMKAMMIHIGACRDSQSVSGGTDKEGSPFTYALQDILKSNEKIKGYQKLVDEFEWRTEVLPVLNFYGPVTAKFKTEYPFQI